MSDDSGDIELAPSQLAMLAQAIVDRLPVRNFALSRDDVSAIAQTVLDGIMTARVLEVLAASMARCLTGINLTLTDQAITRVADEIRAGVAQAVIEVDAKTFAGMTADLLRADPLRVIVEPTQASHEINRLRPLAHFLDKQTTELNERERELFRRGQLLTEREQALAEREKHVDHIANVAGRPLTNQELAAALGVNPASIRNTLTHNQGRYYGVTPHRDQRGHLHWPADTLAQLTRAGKLPKTPQPRQTTPPEGRPEITVLGLTLRSQNALLASGVVFVDQVPRDRNDLLRLPNMGRRSADEVLEELAKFEHQRATTS